MPRRAELRVPENLKVRGRGLSPGREGLESPLMSPHSSRTSTSVRTSVSDVPSSDDDMASLQSEEYTVLDGVREMNSILVRQIETLRLKIKVDESNHGKSHAKLVETKDTMIQQKEEEIDDLKDSLESRDERIMNLTKASVEKDRTILEKVSEIEEMKLVVEQTKKYASKLHRQWSKVRLQKSNLEKDEAYQQQSKEISKLTEELEVLRSRLKTLEEELQRASEVIELQGDKMVTMDADRASIQAKFREELDKASKAMRQEVERMREVMHQNCDEMRTLRDQNIEMHQDVRLIKELLRASRESMVKAQAPPPNVYVTQTHGQATPLSPKGPGAMAGGNIAHRSAMLQRLAHTNSITGRESSHVNSGQTTGKSGNFRNMRGGGQTNLNRAQSVRETSQSSLAQNSVKHAGFRQMRPSGQTEAMPSASADMSPSARGSPDLSSRTISPSKLGARGVTQFNMMKVDNTGVNNSNVKQRAKTPQQPQQLPPVCGFKEGVTPAPLARQNSSRGGRVATAGLRRGSAAVKK